MNLKELQAEHLRKFMDLKRFSESDITRNKSLEEKDTKERDDFSFARRWDTSSETVVSKSKEFLNKERNLKMMMQARQRRLIRIRENIKKINASVKDANKVVDSGIKEDKNCIRKKHPVTERDHGEIKDESDQVSNHLEQFLIELKRVKKMLEESGIFLVKHDSHLKGRQTPAEFFKSIRDDNCMEARRYHVRREVSNNRRNNQLKAANLNRGLVMEETHQEVSKSDLTFDLTSLDEALPPVSHYKRVPGIKRRTLKLQDIVLNNMEENRLFRLAATGLCSIDNSMEEENS